jgi:hypothetical protein
MPIAESEGLNAKIGANFGGPPSACVREMREDLCLHVASLLRGDFVAGATVGRVVPSESEECIETNKISRHRAPIDKW